MNRILIFLVFVMSGFLFANAEREEEHVLQNEHASKEIALQIGSGARSYVYFFIPGDSDEGYVLIRLYLDSDGILLQENEINEFCTALNAAKNKFTEWKNTAVKNLPDTPEYYSYKKDIPVKFPEIDIVRCNNFHIDDYFMYSNYDYKNWSDDDVNLNITPRFNKQGSYYSLDLGVISEKCVGDYCNVTYFESPLHVDKLLSVLTDSNVQRIFKELRAQPSTKQRRQQIDDLFQ